jgi:hypothetical protein
MYKQLIRAVNHTRQRSKKLWNWCWIRWQSQEKRQESIIGDIDASEEEEDIEVVRSLFPLVDKCDIGLTRWHVYSSLK